MSDEKKEIEEELRKQQHKTRVMNNAILEGEVRLILLKLIGEVLDGYSTGELPNIRQYATKIVSYIREHIT